MFDELLKLPGVENASGALLWFITIAAVVIASLPHIVTLVRQGKDAQKERKAESAGDLQAKTSQFESISAAEARLRTDAFKERDRIQERFDKLEARYNDLEEQNDGLRKQNEELKQQLSALSKETGKQTETLERIERNTENG